MGMARSTKEGMRNCQTRSQISPPHHPGSSKPPSYLLSVLEAEDAQATSLLLLRKVVHISDHPCHLSHLWWPVTCIWSQHIPSGKENGEENELGHTLVKGWCTDSQRAAHNEGEEQNKDHSKHSLHSLGRTWWKNPHLNSKASAGDRRRRMKKRIRTLRH